MCILLRPPRVRTCLRRPAVLGPGGSSGRSAGPGSGPGECPPATRLAGPTRDTDGRTHCDAWSRRGPPPSSCSPYNAGVRTEFRTATKTRSHDSFFLAVLLSSLVSLQVNIIYSIPRSKFRHGRNVETVSAHSSLFPVS